MTNYQLISPEIQNEAALLTRLELNTWKLHDKKMPHKLMSAMATLYSHIFPLTFETAFDTLEPWLSAVWWHDIAETAEDGGMTNFSELYWDKVKDGLTAHYSMLIEELGIDSDANIVARHDFDRWVAHHRREFEKYVKHDAGVITGLTGIPFEDAYNLARLRGEAVWMHNDTHLETGVDAKEAEQLWEKTQKKLLEHYVGYLLFVKSGMNQPQGPIA